jgi:hypothetical protein
VRHVHQTKPAQHRIKGSIREIEFLSVHGTGLNLFKSTFTGDLLRKVNYPFRDVGGQNVSARADTFGGTDRWFTGPGRDIQNALTWLNTGHVKQLAGNLSIPKIQSGSPAPPCSTVLVPLLSLRILVPRCVEWGVLFGHD